MFLIHQFTPWETSAGAPTLNEEGLHLWRIQTAPDGPDQARLWPLLDSAEQGRAQRFATETLRRRFVQAHGGLRSILGLYLNKNPQAIVFTHSEQGKPLLDRHQRASADGIEFNLSGSHELALVAISARYPVGVDCEWVRPRTELLGVARRMFPAPVAQRVEAAPEDERLRAFYLAWTALEADVKTDGRGLFRPRPAHAPTLDTAHFAPWPGYIAAVARERLPPPLAWSSYAWQGPA